MELRDDSKTTFEEATGLSTYSNIKAGVLSYVAIFEKLWNQIELYQQVREANERLKLHDKMQQEFINVALMNYELLYNLYLVLLDFLVQQIKL